MNLLPELYNLSVVCRFDRKKTERKDVSFGMREIDNGQGILTVNGNRIFLRGTLECCIFPLTGTPPMTEEGWMKVFATVRGVGAEPFEVSFLVPAGSGILRCG